MQIIQRQTRIMNKTQYRQMRRLVRDNGRYALKWMNADTREAFEYLLFNVQDSKDWLAVRADIVAWCKREGVYCTPFHTTNPTAGRKLDQVRTLAAANRAQASL